MLAMSVREKQQRDMERRRKALCQRFLENQLGLDERVQQWKFLMTPSEIEQAVQKLAKTISEHYKQSTKPTKPLLLVGILKGVFVFLADLCRALDIPYSVYFVEASSYSGQEQEQKVQFLSQLVPEKFQGKTVLVVDELYDRGHTMKQVCATLIATPELGLTPADVRRCVLWSKASKEQTESALDFVGLYLPNVWVVGYGLDDNGEKRGWKYLFAVPKADGVDKSPDDVVFDSDQAWETARHNILQQL